MARPLRIESDGACITSPCEITSARQSSLTRRIEAFSEKAIHRQSRDMLHPDRTRRLLGLRYSTISRLIKSGYRAVGVSPGVLTATELCRQAKAQAHAPSNSIVTMMTAAISQSADLISRQHFSQKFVLYILFHHVFVCCGSPRQLSNAYAIQESL